MLINIIGFQLGWFSCILGSAYQLPWLGVLSAAIILLAHTARSQHWPSEVSLLLAAMFIGLIFDAMALNLGWITFMPVSYWPSALPPPWMIMLWALFASTMNSSLSWLKPRLWLAILLGAIAGPMCYWAGAKLGALKITDLKFAMVYLSVGWAIILPTMLKIASLTNHRHVHWPWVSE